MLDWPKSKPNWLHCSSLPIPRQRKLAGYFVTPFTNPEVASQLKTPSAKFPYSAPELGNPEVVW